MQTGHAASTACHFETATATNKGIGQLAQAYTVVGTLKDCRRIHQYDTLGRPNLTTQLLSDGSYTSKTDFDLWGRAITQTYSRNNDVPRLYGSRYNSFAYLCR